MTYDFSRDFGPITEGVWLNCAHQGPMPRVAVEEAYEAVAWKIDPYHLSTLEPFNEVPRRLKRALGKLIGAPAEEIILANSASYGLHLLANGIPWRAGDEVLLVKGDFPCDILPWLALEKKGVRVRLIDPRSHHVLQVDELLAHVTPSSRVLCTTWVHSFSGWAVDVEALGEACRTNGIRFVLNCSQALGAREFDLSTVSVDALTCMGAKWLCGPYGTGFCWMAPELLDSLDYNQAYWLTMQAEDDLESVGEKIELRTDLGAGKYDLFGTANFFNFKPWAAAVEYLLQHGVENIEAYDRGLVSRLIEGLDPQKYNLVSPRRGPAASTIVVVSHNDSGRNPEIHAQLQRARIYISLREGNLRFSPHLYNTEEDIDALLSVLNQVE